MYRKQLCEHRLIDNFEEGYSSIYELFKDKAKKFGARPCLGDIVKLDGKDPYYEWLTYDETHDLVLRTAKLI